MIAFIDHSRDWKGCRTSKRDCIRLMEALFRKNPEQRPASGLEVFMLSSALDCPEAHIERLRAIGIRLVTRRYAPTMPA
jgi:hypothetical protein